MHCGKPAHAHEPQPSRRKARARVDSHEYSAPDLGYYTEQPDPSERASASPSAHRGTADHHSSARSTRRTFSRFARRSRIPRRRGHHGAALPRHGHASALGAGVDFRRRSARGQWGRAHERCRRRLHAHPPSRTRSSPTIAAVRERPRGTASSSRPRTIRPPTAASNTTRRTAAPADTDITGWMEKRANEILAEGLREVKRLPLAKARATATAFDYVANYVNDLGAVHRFRRDQIRRPAHRRRSARQCIRCLLAAHRRALRPRPHARGTTRSTSRSGS